MIVFIHSGYSVFDTKFTCEGCGKTELTRGKRTTDAPQGWLEQRRPGEPRDSFPHIYCSEECEAAVVVA
jgi:hypothetical protein